MLGRRDAPTRQPPSLRCCAASQFADLRRGRRRLKNRERLMVVKFVTKNGCVFRGPPYTKEEVDAFYPSGSIVSVFRGQQPPQEQQQPQHTSWGPCCASQQIGPLGFRFGSTAEVTILRGDFRFVPESDQIYRRHSASGERRMARPKRRLVPSRQASVFSEQCSQRAPPHDLAIAAQVFFVHCFFVGLSCFRFHGDLRSQ
jgi:hypothetical protein